MPSNIVVANVVSILRCSDQNISNTLILPVGDETRKLKKGWLESVTVRSLRGPRPAHLASRSRLFSRKTPQSRLIG